MWEAIVEVLITSNETTIMDEVIDHMLENDVCEEVKERGVCTTA